MSIWKNFVHFMSIESCFQNYILYGKTKGNAIICWILNLFEADSMPHPKLSYLIFIYFRILLSIDHSPFGHFLVQIQKGYRIEKFWKFIFISLPRLRVRKLLHFSWNARKGVYERHDERCIMYVVGFFFLFTIVHRLQIIPECLWTNHIHSSMCFDYISILIL